MTRFQPRSLRFTLLLGALVTMASFATDMGLPVLGDTAASLGVGVSRAALTLSVFLAGFAFGPLVFGPLSDRWGRRPVLLGGVAAFALFGALATLAGSLGALLAWRFLMGVGAGTAQVLVLAVVRDTFSGREARVQQSYVNLAGGIAPIIAPTVGVWVAAAGGWRAIYAALALGGVVLLALAAMRLRESAPARDTPSRISPRAALAGYATVLRHPAALGNVLVMALSFGVLFAYVSGSSLVLIDVLGVSRGTYGLLFASTSAGLMLGSIANARLHRRGVAHGRLMGGGLATVLVVSLLLVALAAAGALPVWALVLLLVVANVGQGIVRPNAAQGALEPLPHHVGTASAVLSATQMLTGAFASAVASSLFDGRTALAMTGTMAACALGAAAAYVWLVRPAERRLALTGARSLPAAGGSPATSLADAA